MRRDARGRGLRGRVRGVRAPLLVEQLAVVGRDAPGGVGDRGGVRRLEAQARAVRRERLARERRGERARRLRLERARGDVAAEEAPQGQRRVEGRVERRVQLAERRRVVEGVAARPRRPRRDAQAVDGQAEVRRADDAERQVQRRLRRRRRRVGRARGDVEHVARVQDVVEDDGQGVLVQRVAALAARKGVRVRRGVDGRRFVDDPALAPGALHDEDLLAVRVRRRRRLEAAPGAVDVDAHGQLEGVERRGAGRAEQARKGRAGVVEEHRAPAHGREDALEGAVAVAELRVGPGAAVGHDARGVVEARRVGVDAFAQRAQRDAAALGRAAEHERRLPKGASQLLVARQRLPERGPVVRAGAAGGAMERPPRR